MYDNDMTNILKNFAGAGSEGGITDAKTGKAKINHAAQEKNAMKSILEGLDAQQKSVNQMPSTHRMGKNGAKHPASKYLVGGEFDDDGWPARGMTSKDDYALSPDVDDDDHDPFGEEPRLDDDGYEIEEDTIAQRTPPKTQMNKKQSFKDIFRSMEETEEDMTKRFTKELHDEREERILNKGSNGKFDLAEDTGWGNDLIEELKGLLYRADDDMINSAEGYHLLRTGVMTLIDRYAP